ncbi:MAG: PAS domain S-box protein [Planctomycetota bacterium]|jgi:PAS domain S-box-containing protein
MEGKLRKTSIEAVGNISWGTHFCQFYQTKEDLIDILVPYFKAGLEDNEFCMWITAEPLNAYEAHKALQKKVRNLDDYIKKGQIEILEHSQWYTKSENIEPEAIIQDFINKAEYALKKGFDGLRITGNSVLLERKEQGKFSSYEEHANMLITNYKMIALCSYSLDNCNPSEIIDVVNNHEFTLIKQEGNWNTIRSSDRKKADEARQKSEHRYRTLVEANPYGIQEIDTTGNITYTNPTYQKMLGYTEQELLGKSVLDLLETESKRDELRDYLSILVKEQPQPTTYYKKNRTKDNRIVDMMVDWNYKRDNEGRVVGFASVITDITERKKAQEELKRSKEFITNVINTLDDPFFVKDQEHKWFMLNDAACKVMGRPREELIGKSDYDLFPKEQADKFWERDSFVLKSGQTDLNEEEITWHSKLHTISTKKSLFTDSITGHKFITGTIRDITERKTFEKELKRSAETARAFLNATTDSGLLVDRDGLIIDLNDRMAESLGRTRSDMIGTIIYDYMPPALAEQRKAKGVEAVSKREPIRFEDQRENRWFENSVYPIFDSKGEIVRFAIFSRDITERKRAEEALFKEKKFTEDAINTQIDTFFLFDPGTGKAIRWNKAFTNISGYTDGEIARMPAPASYYSPEDLERTAAFIQNVLKEGAGAIELELICKDGRKVPTEYRVSIINDDQGGPKYIISIGRDITERKLVEEELKLHEIRLQALLDLNKMMEASQQKILDFVREEIIKVTQSQFAFIGFMNDDESVMSTENWSKNTMAQCAVVDKPMRFTIAEGGLWSEAVRHRKPVIVNDYNAPHPMKRGFPQGHVPIERFLSIPVFDGEHIVAVASVANKVNDYNESDIRAIESMMNDTWRLLRQKQNEKEIQNLAKFPSEDKNPVLRFSSDGTIIYANKASSIVLETWGCSIGERISQPCSERITKAFETGEVSEFEFTCNNGRIFSVSLAPVVEAGYANAYGYDITERKDIEARQQLAGQILECLNRESVGADLIRDILKLVKKVTNLDAVGIRQHKGNDFPYYEVNGFPDDFVKAENNLCMQSETGELIFDSKGRPILECMCGVVLSDRTDPTLPFFTEGGSFWTNSTTELLTSTPQEALQVSTRNRCNKAGYESVALIPLRSGDEIVGLLQLNDTRKERFTSEMVRFFEEIGASIGIGLARIRTEQEVENLAKFPSENPYPVLRIEKDGMVLYSNAAGSELLGNWGCKVGEQAPEHWQENILRTLKSGRNESLEATCRDRIFSLTIAPVPDSGYVNVYGSDITERKHAEESLRKYQQQLKGLVQTRTAELTETNKRLLLEIEGRKHLEKEILNISEREHKRIGQELHDSIGQQFTGIAFLTKVLEQKLTEKLPDEATDATEIKKLVNQAMDQTRSLARGLHPVDLDAGSFTSVLQELAATTENLFGLRCTLKYDKSITIDDAEVATHLYRITQEAITNAIKHGKTKNIHIELGQKGDKSVLKVENDGLDFPEELEARGTGMGLQIMDHRADIIGASFDIHKAAEGGTIVTCSFSNKTH